MEVLGSEAARHADVSLQTVRDLVLRFNASGPDGLVASQIARDIRHSPTPIAANGLWPAWWRTDRKP